MTLRPRTAPHLPDTTQDGAGGPLTRLAAGALVVAQVGFLPFAFWHGSLETTNGATTLSVVNSAREGWYWLHYGTLACLFATALSLISLASWAAGQRRVWVKAAALLLPVSVLNLAIAFGTEAVGFYYLTEPGLVDPGTATSYLQKLSDGGHYGILIGTGLLAYTLGEAAVVRVLAARRELPVVLRRLLPVAVVLDFVKIGVPLPVGGALAFIAAAIWAGLGITLLRALPSPHDVKQNEVQVSG